MVQSCRWILDSTKTIKTRRTYNNIQWCIEFYRSPYWSRRDVFPRRSVRWKIILSWGVSSRLSNILNAKLGMISFKTTTTNNLFLFFIYILKEFLNIIKKFFQRTMWIFIFSYKTEHYLLVKILYIVKLAKDLIKIL